MLEMKEVQVVTAGPLPRLTSALAGPSRPHGQLCRWAVGLSLVCGAMIAASIVIIAISAAVGTEPRWLGMLLGTGMPGSLVAFVLAIVARARGERWMLLWLPVGLLPAAAAFLVLGEVFVWE